MNLFLAAAAARFSAGYMGRITMQGYKVVMNKLKHFKPLHYKAKRYIILVSK